MKVRWAAWLLAYFHAAELFPSSLIAWFTVRFNKVHRRSLPEAKRKAVLQRRGLFDFVSPLTVLLAVLAYFLFVAFMFYVARHPFPGFGGPFVNIGIVSAGVHTAGCIRHVLVLYGRKKDPLQTHADRMRMIRAVVNAYAWMCILVPIFVSLTVARKLRGSGGDMGPVRGNRFFPDPHASQSPYYDRAAAPAGSGCARFQPGSLRF